MERTNILYRGGRFLIVWGILIALFACGSDDMNGEGGGFGGGGSGSISIGALGAGSCRFFNAETGALSVCSHSTGAIYQQKDIANQQAAGCADGEGTWSTTEPCPGDESGVLFSCVMSQGKINEFWMMYYPGSGSTAGQQNTVCGNQESRFNETGLPSPTLE